MSYIAVGEEKGACKRMDVSGECVEWYPAPDPDTRKRGETRDESKERDYERVPTKRGDSPEATEMRKKWEAAQKRAAERKKRSSQLDPSDPAVQVTSPSAPPSPPPSSGIPSWVLWGGAAAGAVGIAAVLLLRRR